MFDKSEALFPVRRDHIDLATCSIGPMYAPAAAAAQAFIAAHSELGMRLREPYAEALDGFRRRVAEWLRVDADDVAHVSNTAEGLGLIANGYPFEPGDQVVGYEWEFPSNHFPWVVQSSRGVEWVELPDRDVGSGVPEGQPRGWSMDDLDAVVTDRTRILAISHVQFVSGFTADLRALGDYCAERGIDLVVDAAQSLGALPVHPSETGVAALVSPAWKWTLASRGAGLLYTSPEFREKIRITVAGDATMTHRLDYLNRRWEPFPSARRFEPSTIPWEHLLAIECVVREVFLEYGMHAIRNELIRLQDLLIGQLETPRIRPVVFPDTHRSGILSCTYSGDPQELVAALASEDIVTTSQGGYLRLAPHFFVDDDDIGRVAAALNRLA